MKILYFPPINDPTSIVKTFYNFLKMLIYYYQTNVSKTRFCWVDIMLLVKIRTTTVFVRNPTMCNNLLSYCFLIEKNKTNRINMLLTKLSHHLNNITKDGLVESKIELAALLKNLALVWIHCSYFQNYNYIVVFIKCICNMIIAEVNKNIIIIIKMAFILMYTI